MPLKLFCCCYKQSTTIDDKPQETLPFEDRMKNEQSDFISRGTYIFVLTSLRKKIDIYLPSII